MDTQVIQPAPQSKLAAISALPVESTYYRVLAAIGQHKGSMVPVPELSRLLSVKTTTLNARFRRESVRVSLVGRTNYICSEVALKLAEAHKYALLGWLTLPEASRATAVKQATLKARCEKGQLEAYLDLTKRLRINPEEIEKLVWPRSQNRLGAAADSLSSFRRQQPPGRIKTEGAERTGKPIEWAPSVPRPRVFSAGPEPEVKFITERDYGFPETPNLVAAPGEKARPPVAKRGTSNCLSYDPDRPFSVSQCAVGKSIRYGPYEGRILKIFDDPFNPRIQVKFPGHDLPVMREVCLVVEKRHQ